MQIPAGSVTPSSVAAGSPGNYIPAGTMRHRYSRQYATSSATAPAADTKPIHQVVGATATLISVQASLVVPCTGTAAVTVDLKIAGASVLLAPISLTSAEAARAAVVATISTSALTVGQELEVVITASAGTGAVGEGLLVTAIIDEDPV